MKNVFNPIDLSRMQSTLKGYHQSLGKETLPHHYVNEVRLIRYAISGRPQVVSDIKPVTRAQRKLFKRVIDMNRQLISEGVNYQLRKLVCRQMVENYKSKSST